MTLLFWLSALLIGYVYVGYPAVLVVWTWLWRRRRYRNSEDAALPPLADEAPGNRGCLQDALARMGGDHGEGHALR